MLSTNLKYAWRNLRNNKSYGAINIIGLAIGLASFIVILLYLNYELSYDRWDVTTKRIYKISARADDRYAEATPAPLASFLQQRLPEVETATSIVPAGSVEVLLSAGDRKIYQTGSVCSDSLFFQVFPYEFLIGEAATASNKPNAIVLSQPLSKKLFGNENPIGRLVKLYGSIDCEVAGVFQLPNGPSHLDVQFVWRSPYEKQNMQWGNLSYQTYVRTNHELPVALLESKADKSYYEERLKEGNTAFEVYRHQGNRAGLYVDAVRNIHNFPRHGSTSFSTVTVLLLLAVLLLVSGAINFSNLTIASAVRRAKEVGLRKVFGSSKKQLRWMFLHEAVLQCCISLLLALLLVQVALPYFNPTFGLNLHLFSTGNIFSIGWQIGACLLIVVLLSGLYPSVYLSLFTPAKVLKGDYTRSTKGIRFRNTLIVLQFVVSSFFIMGSLVIGQQMRYMQTEDKGFSGTQVMQIEATQKTRDKNFDAVRSILLSIPGVQAVAKSTTIPGEPQVDTSTYDFLYKGQTMPMTSVKVSSDYFSLLNIHLLSGRLFDGRYADQHTQTAVINEAAAARLGLTNPVGATIAYPSCDSGLVTIVGVVKNFHVAGFEMAVQPILYTIGNNTCMMQSGGALLVKLNGTGLQKTIAGIEASWKGVEPDFPIRYSFLDEDFQKLLQSYFRLQQLTWFFTGAAILISVMGLIALTAFFLQRRTKEIGIRKVLGASVTGVVALLSKDFVKLTGVAFVIATPIAWWAAQEWLKGFSYRVHVQWWWFAISGGIVLIITLLSISSQVIKAAVDNPAKSLRSE
jgi:putative ABC transport system permease protein